MYPKKKLIIGIDEVGRGSLAGPVCSAAVILTGGNGGQASDILISKIKDSKLLSPKKRVTIYNEIISQKIIFGLGWASVEEIDKLNILKATLLSMVRAYKVCSNKALIEQSQFIVKIDGIHSPKNFNGPWADWSVMTETVKNGDNLIKEIAAASILAKVSRDSLMVELDFEYPEYHFKQNMGYGTAKHLEMLNVNGPCAIHRKTFKPIKKL